MHKRIFTWGSIILLLVLAACGNGEGKSASGEGKEESGKLKIYTTLYPLQDFAERIGGEHVEVESILPAGANPHTFEPTTKMMVELAKADAFIYNGANLEAYATKISESIEDEGVQILEASNGVELLTHVHDHAEETQESENHTEEGHEDHGHEDVNKGEHDGENHTEEGHEEHGHEDEDKDEQEGESHKEEGHEGHDHGDEDPHVWLDPIRAITLAENIKDQLVELDPDSKEDFEANFEDLKEELTELDQTFHSKLESADSNKILVSHAAYGYWEKAYGIEQIAISGLSPTNEPSQKQLETIIEKSKKNNINTILFEQNVTPKVASVIQKEMNADLKRIHNLSVLTKEDLEADEDYFSLMNHNLEVLLDVLNN